MSMILNSSLQDVEKWKNYEQVLRRYLFNVQKPSISVKEEKNLSEPMSLSTDKIISSVPTKFKNKAQRFMDFLSNGVAPNRISWDEKGVNSIDNQPIENTNIVDILNDIMRPRKNFHPEGKHQIAEVLKDLSVPQEFIGNEFYNRLNKQKLPSSTPKHVNKTTFMSANESSMNDSFEESTNSRGKNKSQNHSKSQNGRGWLRIHM